MSRTCRRHWFAYYGRVGSSSPVCVRCGSPNANYRPDDDPMRIHAGAFDAGYLLALAVILAVVAVLAAVAMNQPQVHS